MPKGKSTKKTNKMSLNKAQKMVTKKRAKQAKVNADTHYLKAVSMQNLVPGQGVTVANYIYCYFSLDPANGASIFTNNADFNLYRQLYDRFRINKVTVKLTPKANVLDATLAQTDDAYNLTGDGKIHTCIDRDGIAPSSISAISRYSSYKAYSVLKPMTRSYRVSYPKNLWLDTGDVGNSMQKLSTLGLFGGITIYGENFIEDNYELFNEPVYEAQVSWDIVFQGKTNGKLSAVLDENNNVIGVQVTNQDNIVSLPQTPAKNIRGELVTNTRTSDEVTEVQINASDE